MSDDFSWPAIVLILLVSGVALLFATNASTHEAAYRQGQIDYANGIIKYQLQPLPTGETVWKKRKE